MSEEVIQKISYMAGLGPGPPVDHQHQEQHPSQQGIWMCIAIITQLGVLKS